MSFEIHGCTFITFLFVVLFSVPPAEVNGAARRPKGHRRRRAARGRPPRGSGDATRTTSGHCRRRPDAVRRIVPGEGSGWGRGQGGGGSGGDGTNVILYEFVRYTEKWF